MRIRWTLSLPILLAGWLLAGLSAAVFADDQAVVAKGKYLARAGDCIACHAGSEFTGASFSARLDPVTKDGLIERMVMKDGRRWMCAEDPIIQTTLLFAALLRL